MKKSKKYMSEESFNLLVESLNQAIEYERGERDDLRVTVVPAPPRTEPELAQSETSIKEAIVYELEGLSEATLKQVADYVAYLKFRERSNQPSRQDESQIAALYAEFADEDRALVEEGMEDHLRNLALEELLEGITEENRHNEIDIGPSSGKEGW